MTTMELPRQVDTAADTIPIYPHRERLGTSAIDKHGSAERDQIANYAFEFRNAQT